MKIKKLKPMTVFDKKSGHRDRCLLPSGPCVMEFYLECCDKKICYNPEVGSGNETKDKN
jgi:hypothetical protein